MSYEGYEQVLCENGHYYIYDCYDFWESEGWKCPSCGGNEEAFNKVWEARKEEIHTRLRSRA